VFVGPNGIGPWQDRELDAFLREFVRRHCPVIPVILRGNTAPPALPPFLGGMTWVDFRKRNPDPLERLIWGITGERRLAGEDVPLPAPMQVVESGGPKKKRGKVGTLSNQQTPVVTEEHLQRLPRRAMVALAARCARRVQPLCLLPEGHPERE